MTSKDKAIELVNKFDTSTVLSYKKCKECALIAVDEIIESIMAFDYSDGNYLDYVTNSKVVNSKNKPATYYWQQVKTAIENL